MRATLRNGLGLLAVSGAAQVAAHTIFVQLESGGTTYPVSYAIADPSYDGPITDVTSNYLACNGGPNPTTPSNNTINVAAGSSVTAIWRHTLTSGADDVMDASHKGPTLAYMKKVDNAVTDAPDAWGGGWFKIQEAGYSNGVWATTNVINNAGQHVINIPSCIENGQYLLRAEMIALHAASAADGAQLYMECAQIIVSGGTGSVSPTTYSIPGIYKATDPGLLINIYSMNSSSTYDIPGPDPFTCSGGGTQPSSGTTGSAPSPSTTMATQVSSSTTTTRASSSAGPSSSSSSCSVAMYGQCGGSGYSGCTTCASGSTCKVSNQYYSQCL